MSDSSSHTIARDFTLGKEFASTVRTLREALDALEERLVKLYKEYEKSPDRCSETLSYSLADAVKLLCGSLDSKSFSHLERQVLKLLVEQRKVKARPPIGFIKKSGQTHNSEQRYISKARAALYDSGLIESLVATAKNDQALAQEALLVWQQRKDIQKRRVEQSIAFEREKKENEKLLVTGLRRVQADLAYGIWLGETMTKEAITKLQECKKKAVARLESELQRKEFTLQKKLALKSWSEEKKREADALEQSRKRERAEQRQAKQDRGSAAEIEYKKWLKKKSDIERQRRAKWEAGDKEQLRIVLSLNNGFTSSKCAEIIVPQYLFSSGSKQKPEWVS